MYKSIEQSLGLKNPTHQLNGLSPSKIGLVKVLNTASTRSNLNVQATTISIHRKRHTILAAYARLAFLRSALAKAEALAFSPSPLLSFLLNKGKLLIQVEENWSEETVSLQYGKSGNMVVSMPVSKACCVRVRAVANDMAWQRERNNQAVRKVRTVQEAAPATSNPCSHQARVARARGCEAG